MIKPEAIDLKSLPWLPLDEKTAFPKRSAIYFAIDSLGKVQYIGRSKDVRSRWGSHHKYKELSEIGDIKIAYLFADLPELLPQIEKALIEYFNPPLNTIKSSAEQTPAKGQEAVRVYMSPEKKRAFKSACAARGLEMSEVANQLIEEWLTENAVSGIHTQAG